ncbi:MAG: hypothetical protein AAGA48_17355 [Myxococcota bacterium]
MSESVPLDWVVDVDVDAQSDLHQVVRAYLAKRPPDQRPVHRAVYGALGMLLGRSVSLSGVVAGDQQGPVEVNVQLPSGIRRALRLVIAAVPSRWRWRSDGAGLVGRAPRQGRLVGPEMAPVDRQVSWTFAVDEAVHEVPIQGLPQPVQALRHGEIHLREVSLAGAEVRWRLRFDDDAAAASARRHIEAMLERVAQAHGAHGLRYDGSWSLEGACVSGVYHARAEAGWPAAIAGIAERDSRNAR